MEQYPDCPYCGNSTSTLSIVDVEINGAKLKGIQCNNCKKYIGFFQDNSQELNDIRERIEELESDVSDIQ